MSRPPTPTALRLVNNGKLLRREHRERAAREPQGTPGLREPASYLNAEQLAIWRRIEADSPPGLLQRTDSDLVESYVMLLSARNAAARGFNDSAQIMIPSVGRRGTVVLNPFLKQLRNLTSDLRLLQGDLGFTPLARGRVAPGMPKPTEPDPLAPFLTERQPK